MSAASMASSTWGRAAGRSGMSRTRRMRASRSFLASAMCDSPVTSLPSSNSAARYTFSLVTGRTRPVMARTSLILRTASSKVSDMPLSAARKRLPKLWPFRLPSVKR